MEGKSYNSYGRGESWNRILTYLEKAEGPQTPISIASATNLNHNSVRVWLREMKRRGLAHQPGYGLYETTKKALTLGRYGVGELRCLPRVHNLMIRGRCRAGVSGVFSFGSVKVRIDGERNGACIVYLSCGEGVDFVGFSILMGWLEEKLDWLDEPEVCRYELNDDYAGVELDGCSTLTLKAFNGSLERIYNKGDSLRSEVRPAKGVDPLAVCALLKGGIAPYTLLQSCFLLVKETRAVLEAVKWGNRMNQKTCSLLAEFLGRLWKSKKGQGSRSQSHSLRR